MKTLKINLLILAMLLLSDCSTAAGLRPLSSDSHVAIEVIDSASLPMVTAQLCLDNDSVVIIGEVRKKGDIPLNGYISLAILDPSGHQIWSNTAELTPSGPPRHHYRVFKKSGLPPLPPGSKVIVEFHKSA